MASIITTKNSNRQNYLTFLNTYPTSASSLNLKSTGGYTSTDYTGTYWRPTDSTGNTPKATIDGSIIELGFNVKWGNYQTSGDNKGKIRVDISLMLSEKYYWLNVTNSLLQEASSTSTVRGYNYYFDIQGETGSNSWNAPICEVVNNNNNKPDFSQSVNEVTNYYTFRTGNATSTRTYIGEHSTQIWNRTFYLRPSNGVASVTVNVTRLYLHWQDIYNGKKPCIWCGESSKTFTSPVIYTKDVSMSPTQINLALVPNKATIKTLVYNASHGLEETNNRNFWNYVNNDRTVIDRMSSYVNSYKDSTSNHKIILTNNSSGTLMGNIAWTVSNPNVIKLSSTNTSTTNAIFNGLVGNAHINAKVTPSNITKACTVKYTLNNTVTYSSNNTSMATVTSQGEITAKKGMNGGYTISAKYNGGLTVNTKFNSYLVPNNIVIYSYKYGTATPTTTINRGEKLTIRAAVQPYNASNSYTSVHTDYRNLTFALNNTSIGSLSTASPMPNNVPYYTTIYTAPTGVGEAQTVKITVTQPYTSASTGVSNSITININSNVANPLPTLQVYIKSITSGNISNPTSNNSYSLITYDVIPASGQRSLTVEEKNYVANIPLNYYNQSYTDSTYGYTTTATLITNSDLITNGKRQCVYLVSGTQPTTSIENLIWKSSASITVPYSIQTTEPQQTYNCVTEHYMKLRYLEMIPKQLVMNVGDSFNVNFNFDTVNINQPEVVHLPPFEGIAKLTSYNFNYDSSNNKKGTGTGTIKAISPGRTLFSVSIPQAELYNTTTITVIDKSIIQQIIYPYIYTKNTNLVYDSIRYNNSECLRLVFKLPDADTFNLFSDIQISINYGNNQTILYSLLNNPERFSISYPLKNNVNFNMDLLYQIINNYYQYYNESPYCIFMENVENRDITLQINKFSIRYIVKEQYNYTNINGLYTEITTNNIYNLEDVRVGDKLLGYNENSPTTYSLKPFIDAYKSYVTGYKEKENLNSPYFLTLLNLEHFGLKDTPILAFPFYQFLLSQNCIRAVDKYYMKKYCDVLGTEIGISQIIIDNEDNTFYPYYLRNMYLTGKQIIANDLMNPAKNFINSITNEIIYDILGKLDISVEEEYPMLANDNVDYMYDNPSIINTFKQDNHFSNFTISPLKEFTNNLYINQIYDRGEDIIINVETPTPIVSNLLPKMNGIFGIYLPTNDNFVEVDNLSNTYLLKNSLNDYYNFIIRSEMSNPVLNYITDNNELYLGQTNYGVLNLFNGLNQFTVYVVCKKPETHPMETTTVSTFVSTMVYDIYNSNNTKGICLSNYTTINYNSSSSEYLEYINKNNKQITCTDSINSIRYPESINTQSEEFLNDYHLYTITVSSNGSVNLYVDGVYRNSFITSNKTIYRLMLNGILLTDGTTIVSANALRTNPPIYYKYIAVGNTVQDSNTIATNSAYIMGNYM